MMWIHQPCEWSEPLDAAEAVSGSESSIVLLYSGLRTEYSGRYSFLFLDMREQVCGYRWQELADRLEMSKSWYEHLWAGYLGYGLKNRLERLPEDREDAGASLASVLPDIWMMRPSLVVRFDHDQRRVDVYAEDPEALAKWVAPEVDGRVGFTPDPPVVEDISSSMSTAEYLRKVAEVLEAIASGELYQANLTRKFMGAISSSPDGYLGLFRRLVRASPAPYSAYARMGDLVILSSSPEQFVRMDAGGRAETRPIKGTAPRAVDPQRDEEVRVRLAESEKDRAENLMIVDLMRSDFGRGAVMGSVAVERLYEVSSYATVHHMASTVKAVRRKDCSVLDFVKGCFPPGSMTGAPKVRAMEMCTRLEELKRGVYSGALGWFGGDGGCDLSVVIRTILIQGGRFEFQVGGGIVQDSTPEREWEETMVKARGVCAALGVDAEWLRAL